MPFAYVKPPWAPTEAGPVPFPPGAPPPPFTVRVVDDPITSAVGSMVSDVVSHVDAIALAPIAMGPATVTNPATGNSQQLNGVVSQDAFNAFRQQVMSVLRVLAQRVSQVGQGYAPSSAQWSDMYGDYFGGGGGRGGGRKRQDTLELLILLGKLDLGSLDTFTKLLLFGGLGGDDGGDNDVLTLLAITGGL